MLKPRILLDNWYEFHFLEMSRQHASKYVFFKSTISNLKRNIKMNLVPIWNSHLFLFITSTNCTEISYLDHTGLPETIFPEKQTKKAEKISWICVCFSGNIISGSAVYLNKNLGSISKQQLWLNGRALDYKLVGLWIESHHLLNMFF